MKYRDLRNILANTTSVSFYDGLHFKEYRYPKIVPLKYDECEVININIEQHIITHAANFLITIDNINPN